MKRKTALKFVFFTAVISGVSIFINKFAVSGFNSSIFTFSKTVIVAVFLFSAILAFKKFDDLKELTRKQWLQLGAIGLIGGSIPFLLFFKGLQLTTGAVGSFVHKTMFIFVAVFALMFLKEKVNKKFLISAVLLLLGNALLLKFVWNDFGVAELLILTATAFWASENVLSKHVLKNLNSSVVAFGRMFFGSIFILIFLAFSGQLVLLTDLTLSQLSWILLTSVFLFLYVTTWYTGLKHINVTLATQVLLLGSPITTILSYAFLGSVLTINQSIGILLVVVGVIYAVIFTRTTIYTNPRPQPHIHNE